MNNCPLVSIIIPVYNGSNYLREAIDSALAQTYSNIEIIVVNDGSNDEGQTNEIARSYGEKIKYLVKENGGVATALNVGIEASSGKYLSWLSHDDIYSKDKVAKQVAELEKLEVKGIKAVAYSAYVKIDEQSEIISIFDFPSPGPTRIYQAMLTNSVFISRFRNTHFVLNGCSVLCPRSAFNEVGMFDPSLPTTQDYDLWFKMINTYDFVKVDGLLVQYRVHFNQGSIVLRNERQDEVQDLYVRAFRLYKPGSQKYDLDLPRVVLALKAKGLNEAYYEARSVLRTNRLSIRGWYYLTLASLLNRHIINILGKIKLFIGNFGYTIRG